MNEPITVEPPQKPGQVSPWLVALLLLGVAAVLLRESGLVGRWVWSSSAAPRAVTPRGELAADEQSTIEIFRNASPCVVHITSLAVRRDLSLNLMGIPEGSGTGFVWDEAGHIVTNYHVIQSGNTARVTLANNTYAATLVGVEPDKDLAVLRIEAPKDQLKPIPLGTSEDLVVGQKVFAIGNPFGLDQTLTTGVISGLGREIQSQTRRTIEGVIQTDAAINPGNSGGPLLDSAGRMIGVNTAIYSPSGAYAGIGFAVPVDIVNNIVPQLIQYGRIEQAGIGVTILSDEFAHRLGVMQGAVIRRVFGNGPAAEAGLQSLTEDEQGNLRFDVIQQLAGRTIRRSEDLLKALDGKKVGEQVAATILRDGKEIKVELTLQPRARALP